MAATDDPEVDAGLDPLDRPPPLPSWRDVIDLDRLLGGRRVGALALAAVVVVIGGGGLWLLLRPPPPPPIEASLPVAGSPSAPGATLAAPVPETTAPVDLVVHAAGAVTSPGVHHLPAGSRVADLLAAAGGPTPDADLDRVNLAAPLVDGAQVRFPRVGEPPLPPVVGGDPASAGGADAAGPLDLNAATVTELEALPGVGPTIAAAIVEQRQRNGPFGSVEDLLDVPGIGSARLDQIRALVSV